MSLSKQTPDTLVNGDLVDHSSVSTPMPGGDTLNSIKDYLSNNPTATGMLLGGTGAGLVGGYLSSRVPGHHGEDKAGRRMRILRNALLAAGVGAGATGLAMSGAKQLNTALPVDDVDPTTHFLEGPIPRTLAVGGVGAKLLHDGIADEHAPRYNVLSQAASKLKKSDPARAESIVKALHEHDPRFEKIRDNQYHDLLKDFQQGHVPGNVSGIATNRAAAGGLSNYDPATAEHWMSQLERLKNRVFGHKMGPKAIGAGAGLGAAVMAPELIKGLWNSVTGGSGHQ